MERSWASSTMRHSVPYWCRCPMSLGLRVLQCPRSGSPNAVKNWSPNACSSSLFFGATTARTDRPPAVFSRSRKLMVLPAPGSATITCQLRLSQASCSIAWNLRAKAVSMKMSFLKGECVIVAAPQALHSEQVRHGQDDQVRHPGQLSGGSRVRVSWPRCSLSAQKRWLDECPGVGDPIDALARLDEFLHFGDGEQSPLRSECERGLAALVHGQSSPAPRRVCAWHWLPTH